MGLFANILNWLRGKVRPHGYSPPYSESENPETWEPFSEDSSSEVMLAAYYDKDLFERARTQWQFGDWESLARIERESLYHHPQRASLALLAAAGHQQRGNMEATREFTRLAKEWGASKKMISQVLIAGVYNTLGKASALCGQQKRAIGHFQESLRTAGNGGDIRLLSQARAGRETGQKTVFPNVETYQKFGESAVKIDEYKFWLDSRKKSSKKSSEKYTNFYSPLYWEDRYRKGGNSGHGSYGRLAEFKAQIINKFITDEKIEQLIEFGCGDGNQLSMLRINSYVGVDISPTIVQKCKEKFKDDPSKIFYTNDEFMAAPQKADLTLSLDVIFHLIEDDIFEAYMDMLFKASERYCIIYACDSKNRFDPATHVRHRNFTDWIAMNMNNWRLSQIIYNKYPHDGSVNPKNFSFSDFYFYERN